LAPALPLYPHITLITLHTSQDRSIENFFLFSEYDELANSCCLTSHQKVEAIIRHITPLVHVLWKSLEGYVAHDWVDFGLALEEIYDSASEPPLGAKDFGLRSALFQVARPMSNEEDIMHYNRQCLVLY
jgi:hypothetical protein